MSSKRNHREIRVRGVSHQVAEDLNNISKNSGVPLSDLLKPKLREIVESYPVNMRRPSIG
jgi:hypothetical protein